MNLYTDYFCAFKRKKMFHSLNSHMSLDLHECVYCEIKEELMEDLHRQIGLCYGKFNGLL